MPNTDRYAELIHTMATATLVHLIETRGTVSPQAKDTIAAELDSRNAEYNRPSPV